MSVQKGIKSDCFWKIGKRLAPLVLILAVFFLPKGLASWQKPVQPSLAGGPLTCLAPHPFDASKFLAASERQLFEKGPHP